MHRINFTYVNFNSSISSVTGTRTPARSRPGQHSRFHATGMLFALLVFILGVASMPSPALANNPDAHLRAEALTNSLVGLNKAYQHASPTAKAEALNTLVNAAAERQALLADLIEDDPGAVLRVAVPARDRAGMPEEVRAFIEQRLELEGELEVLYEDYEDGTHRLRHFLKVYDQRITLHIKAEPPGLLSGVPVKANGVLLDDAMALESIDNILTLAAGGGADGGSNGGTPEPLPNTFGEQQTMVLLVNFQDDPTNEPWTPTEVHDLVFGTVSEFFAENSYSQTWLNGDVYGWYTIGMDSTVWNLDWIAEKANAAANAAGVDLTPYTRFVYVFPRNSGSSLYGAGTVGGDPSRAWFNGRLDLWLVGHEMGHNFGLQHSHALECGATTLGTDCQSYEYGDRLDIMGNYTAGHLNAFQKAQLGWLGYGSSPPITTVETGGEYLLQPYEFGGIGAKALKVLKGVDSSTGEENWYYLEYRQAIGADSFLTGNSNILNGLVFHTGTDSDPRSSFQLDMTPASSSSGYYDWEDAALEQEASFSDPDSGAIITTLWTDAGGASVNVSFGLQSCIPADPAIALTPSESEWVAPGTTVTYDVTVSNNDSHACAPSGFGLAAAVPGGWTASFADPAATLAPGASATTTLEVVSPAASASGFYDIIVTAENSVDPQYTASATATYVVNAGTVNNAPVAVDDNATLVQIEPVTVHVLANDWDPDSDPLAVTAVTQGAKGTVVDNGDGTVTYTPGKRFKNGDSFSYSVSDGIQAVTATVSIAFQKTNGAGKGNGKNK